MKKKVLNTIIENSLIEKNDCVIVGVSGGSDSICLLHFLKQISKELDFKIIATHINHKLRGKDSDDDEEYVIDMCKSLNIKCYSKSFNVKKVSTKKKISIEVAARQIRYGYFEEVLKSENATKIAVAHNKNDQTETIFMNIVRGSGLDGLIGMELAKGVLIRPLLNVEKSEIEEYCYENNLKVRLDKSNLESIYTRNKVRLDIIPMIEKNFLVNLNDNITRMSNILKEDRDFLDEVVCEKSKCMVYSEEKHEVRFLDDDFRELHKSIQKRLIRKGIGLVAKKLTNIENQHIEKILELFQKGKVGKYICLPHKMVALKNYDDLTIKIGYNRCEWEKYQVEIAIEGKTKIEKVGTIKTYLEKRIKDVEDSSKVIYNSLVQKFDYDKIGKGIILRNRQEGDYFKPLRSNGSKKLKKYFIDEKIPKEQRDKIPLIAVKSEILWIIGYKISEKFKVDDNTKRVLIVEFVPEDSVYSE